MGIYFHRSNPLSDLYALLMLICVMLNSVCIGWTFMCYVEWLCIRIPTAFWRFCLVDIVSTANVQSITTKIHGEIDWQTDWLTDWPTDWLTAWINILYYIELFSKPLNMYNLCHVYSIERLSKIECIIFAVVLQYIGPNGIRQLKSRVMILRISCCYYPDSSASLLTF